MFLQLKNPELYTGHCFRQSSASFLADSGAETSILKSHDAWWPNKVAEGYVENSIRNKIQIAKKIMGTTAGPSKTSAYPSKSPADPSKSPAGPSETHAGPSRTPAFDDIIPPASVDILAPRLNALTTNATVTSMPFEDISDDSTRCDCAKKN